MFGSFWGKAQPLADAQFGLHPVWAHSLDVAATAKALLAASAVRRQRLAAALAVPESDAVRLAVWIAALHDLGKFSRAFQSLAPEVWPGQALGPLPYFASRPRHDAIGLWLWENGLEQAVAERAWPVGGDALYRLAAAAFGHHGKPLALQDVGQVDGRKHVGETCWTAALAFTDAVTVLLMPEPLQIPQPRESQPAAFALAGLVNLADWIGSNQAWFPYYEGEADLGVYWQHTSAQATVAVREAGLVPPTPAADLTFPALTKINGRPSPAQEWALDCALPQGPMLICLEDLTGGGKTEAAHILAARRITQGRASGVYWAMPTQATANAMWSRQGGMVSGLFAPQSLPSVVLAHGQAGLHALFQASIGRPGEVYGEQREEETASGHCASWLADDRRRAFLADVGAGTVDQALLGVLPTRFYPLRLFGLAEKVLVLDEVHSFDPYVTREIERLVEFQLRLGGDVVLLSATLAAKTRERFVRMAEEALGIAPEISGAWGAAPKRFEAAADAPYPLATTISVEGAAETPVAASRRVARRVPVQLIGSVDAALATVSDTARRGGACCYIRNTVDDAREAWAALRDQGLDPILFHARFAQCDRQAIEEAVLSVFGKDAPAEARRGRVLVATQVVEQSLDLDFDLLVSDLAPVDSLIQRMGRFRRHPERDTNGERPAGLPEAVLVVAPEPVADAPKDWLHAVSKRMGAVYPDHGLLWRTAMALQAAGAVDTRPTAMAGERVRNLMAVAYAPDGEVPEGLEKATLEAEAKAKASAGIAYQHLLRFEDGYSGEAFHMHEDHAVPTRLGEPTTVVRLARASMDGRLLPWCDSASNPASAWALSEVRLASRLVPEGSRPERRWAAMVEAVTRDWPRYDRDIVVAVLEADDSHDSWRASLHPEGKLALVLAYSETEGATVSTS